MKYRTTYSVVLCEAW